MENIYDVALISVEHAARWFDDLAICPTLEFGWLRPTIGKRFELIDVLKYSAYELLSCRRIV